MIGICDFFKRNIPSSWTSGNWNITERDQDIKNVFRNEKGK